MKINKKNIHQNLLYLLVLFKTILSQDIIIPDIANLKKIYDISDAQDIEIVKNFGEYADDLNYRTPPNCLKKSDLKIIYPNIDWNNLDSYSFKCKKKIYIARINNAFISQNYCGTIFDSKQQFIFRHWIDPQASLFPHIGLDVKDFAVKKYKKIIAIHGTFAYYHWVIERLQSIFLIRDLLLNDHEIKLLISIPYDNFLMPFMQEYLDLLQIPSHQCLIAQPKTLYYADDVYFTTPFTMEPASNKILSNLSNCLVKMAKGTGATEKKEKKYIIIIKRNTCSRKLKNYEELIEAVKVIFDKTYLEIVEFDGNMSVKDQIMLFNNANIVIGVHGAGFANLLYCKPGTIAIEISPEHSIAGWKLESRLLFWWLSSSMSLEHWMIPISNKVSDEYVMCPIDDLSKILEIVKKKIYQSDAIPAQNIKILCTAALINDQFQMRKNEYINCLKKITEFGHNPYIVESCTHGPTFLDDCSKNVFYSKTNNPQRHNKGVNELLSILESFKHFKFDDNDIILKLTGRYSLNSDFFITLIKAHPEIDFFARRDSLGQVVTGCFAMRFKYFKCMLENIDYEKMEREMINFERVVADYVDNRASEMKLFNVDNMDVTANIFGTGKCQLVNW